MNQTFSGFATTFQQIFEGIITFITGVFTGNWNSALDGLVEIFNGAMNLISNMIEAVVNFVINGLYTVIKVLNRISHILICGMSGSGKSYMEQEVLAKLVVSEPDGTRFFADYKSDDSFVYLRDCPRYYSYIDTLQALDCVHTTMTARQSGEDTSRQPVTLIWDEYMAQALTPVAAFAGAPSDVAALNCYEGVAGGHYRIEPVSVDITGHGRLRGFWYVMNGGRKFPPSQSYVQTVAEGYQTMGFDMRILQKALNV